MLKDIAPRPEAGRIERARKLRREMTLPEGLPWRELRIPARAILDDPAAVTAGIVEAARARLPLHHPAAPGGPPPRDELGEELDG